MTNMSQKNIKVVKESSFCLSHGLVVKLLTTICHLLVDLLLTVGYSGLHIPETISQKNMITMNSRNYRVCDEAKETSIHYFTDCGAGASSKGNIGVNMSKCNPYRAKAL